MTAERLRRAAPTLAVLAGLLALVLALYLPYATEAGWFSDDWAVYAEQQESQGSYADGMSACMQSIPGGRKLACIYSVSEWALFGDRRWGYHLVSIAFLVAIAFLAYAVARRAGLGRSWSAAISGAVIVFPGADSTRLWPVASIGQYAVTLQMTSLLLAMIALAHRWSGRTAALHGASLLLALLAMATYEIAVPLVALQGAVYVAAFRNRRAFKRWLVDIGLVLTFVTYRLAIAPASDPNFVVERSGREMVTRLRVLVEGAWDTWRYLYAPGRGLALLAALLLAAAAATVLSPTLRSRLVRWWLLLGAAIVAAAVCSTVFLTANDLYVPQYFGTFNRLNLPGTIPYAVAFVAVLGILHELIRRWSPSPLVAPIAVAVVALAVSAHQLAVRADHQEAWLESWSAQSDAVPGTRTALEAVPPSPRLLGFDTPQWERGWVPVFAQSWDFRGMVEYETPVDPKYASPFVENMSCGDRGVDQDGALVAPYDNRKHPVYFVSPARGIAVHVASRRQCEARLDAWGPAPYWGRTVTG